MAQKVIVQDGVVSYQSSDPTLVDMDFSVAGSINVTNQVSIGDNPASPGLIQTPPGSGVDLNIETHNDGIDFGNIKLDSVTDGGSILLNNVAWPDGTVSPVPGMYLGVSALNTLQFLTLPGGTGTVTSIDITGAQGVTSAGGPITNTGSITVGLGNITPTSVAATGNVGGTSLSSTGNLTFTGTGLRIVGDFSNATATNRLMFQTSTVNNATLISVIPNGTSTESHFSVENNSVVGNNAGLTIYTNSTVYGLASFIRGTGTYLPFIITNAGLRGITIDMFGNVVAGGTITLATTATDRFFYINSMAGTPTGVPTVPTGFTAANKVPVTVDSTNNKLYFYSTGAWHTSNAGNPPSYELFSATAAQTVFNTTLSTVANGAGKAYLQVFVNGVKQIEGVTKNYQVTGATQVTFNAGLNLNDDVEFYAFS